MAQAFPSHWFLCMMFLYSKKSFEKLFQYQIDGCNLFNSWKYDPCQGVENIVMSVQVLVSASNMNRKSRQTININKIDMLIFNLAMKLTSLPATNTRTDSAMTVCYLHKIVNNIKWHFYAPYQ